jgi:hypothetical protein
LKSIENSTGDIPQISQCPPADREDEEHGFNDRNEPFDNEDQGSNEADSITSLETTNDAPDKHFGFFDSHFSNESLSMSNQLGHRKSIYSNPNNAKRARLDERWATQSPSTKVKLGPRKKPSKMPSILRNIISRSSVARVTEPNDMIIKTEDTIGLIYDKARDPGSRRIDFNKTLSDVSMQLTDIWKSYERESRLSRPHVANGTVGPGDTAPGITKASFVGTLLLLLHHPFVQAANEPATRGSMPSSCQSLVLSGNISRTFITIPRVLLNWLNSNHGSRLDDLQALRRVGPNPTASSNFWDIIHAAILRGHLAEVAEALRSADFNYARSALEDGLMQPGYRGTQLQNIQKCINKVVQLLESSPSVRHKDWDITGGEWSLYRKRVASAITDLREFAEGDSFQTSHGGSSGRFQAINFGISESRGATQNGLSFTRSSRMAENRVPWSIYQSVKSIYNIILGDTVAIIAHAQDWVEATIGLTAWWDGDDGEANGLRGSPSNKFSKFHSPQKSFSIDSHSYFQRLDYSFGYVTDDSLSKAGFQPNSLCSVEVGLAAVFEGNVEGVLELMQTWSLCIASAIAEVASAGGWLGTTSGKQPISNLLSEDDLMVLSYAENGNTPPRGIWKDDILTAYADGLFGRDSPGNDASIRAGWEMALEVLARLENAGVMAKKAAELLDKLPMNTINQMDKAVLICNDLGLDSEGRKVSEKFGDHVTSSSDDYGVALICYARARSTRKLKSIVDLLISYSLVESRAFPPIEKLDEQLHALLRDPETCLSAVAAVDAEAARILQFHFSGYATLRRFYETRDEGFTSKERGQRQRRPLARKRAAAEALVAVIRSSSDSIYGGLYDPDRDSAVQVDGLLALLGEALVFISDPSPLLSLSQQSTILSAVEDLETVTPRVFAQCEECFRSTIMRYHSERAAASGSLMASQSFTRPPSPRALLKKSVSSLTASSSFSLIGSEMLDSQAHSGSGSASGVLVPHPTSDAVVQRGWDWRAGLPEDTKGEDVLKILRLGLAKGLSFGALG